MVIKYLYKAKLVFVHLKLENSNIKKLDRDLFVPKNSHRTDHEKNYQDNLNIEKY